MSHYIFGRSSLLCVQYTARYSDQLPGKKLVLALSDTSLFFSLEEYVELYAGPYNIDLESEQTWPLERLVHYH
jgi:hypothetical protein